MCGIAGGMGGDCRAIEQVLPHLHHRGPDAAGFWSDVDSAIGLAHTRLAILDLDSRSDQPFHFGQTSVVFNGEIWNHADLRRELQAQGLSFQTTSDTEVVAAALDWWGVGALSEFNGMFALAWAHADQKTLYLARDRFGEVPLHRSLTWPFRFASEQKALAALGIRYPDQTWVNPGEYLIVQANGLLARDFTRTDLQPLSQDRATAAPILRANLEASVAERLMSDVPVCCLLSGGIDSAAIVALLARHHPGLVCYTARMDPKSPDLRMARVVAEHCGVELREVTIPAPTAADLARVIGHIEQPSKAQVEIGWPCLVLAERIRADGFRVVFTGEGSDELWASYGFAYHGLQRKGWHDYRADLFRTQHRKNFPRCNKIFMAHGIEARLPFLNPTLVAHALRLTREAVQDGKKRPKAVLQDAVRDLLPESVVNRAKIAFQDGLGIKTRILTQLPDPRRFYGVEYERQFG